MKTMIFGLLTIFLTACGRPETMSPVAPGPCAGARVLGSWQAENGSLVFNDKCEVRWLGLNPAPFAKGSLVGSFDETETLALTVDTDESVLPVGAHECAIEVKGATLTTAKSLTITCDGFTWKSGRKPEAPENNCGIWGCK